MFTYQAIQTWKCPVRGVLGQNIANEILRRGGRLPFPEFMSHSLYAGPSQQLNGLGYYYSGRVKFDVGPTQHFSTHPEHRPQMAWDIARQISWMWESLGHPEVFDLYEMGAGPGTLALKTLEAIQVENPGLFAHLNYNIIDSSPALIKRQKNTLGELASRIGFLNTSAISFKLERPIIGCFLSNELPDTFPVHLVTRHEDRLQEVYVASDGFTFTPILAELSDPAINRYFQRVRQNSRDQESLEPEEDELVTVNLRSLDWLSNVEQNLEKGFILTLDYGFIRPKLAPDNPDKNPLVRTYPTLSGRMRSPLYEPGFLDITTDVNFYALEIFGRSQLGLRTEILPCGEKFAGFDIFRATLYAKNFVLLLQSKGLLPLSAGNDPAWFETDPVLRECADTLYRTGQDASQQAIEVIPVTIEIGQRMLNSPFKDGLEFGSINKIILNKLGQYLVSGTLKGADNITLTRLCPKDWIFG